MSDLTDAFDVALQVREGVVDRIFRAMHRVGSIQHHYARAYNGKHIELQIANPNISFVTSSHHDQRARALATSRVLYHSRTLADARDRGTGAVADVTIRAVLWLTSGDPAPLTPATKLAVAWQETTGADITVHGVPAAIQNEVKAALLDFIHDHGGGQFQLPSLGSGMEAIGSIAFRFLPGTSGTEPVLVVGMNTGSVTKGTKAGLQQVFVQHDWALAVSEAFLLQEIRHRLQQQLGNLPPPHGHAPVTVSDTTVCTFPTPFGCADSARQRVILETFDASLEPGAIVFSGQVRQTTDAWYVPDVNATLRAEASLSIGPGQQLTVSLRQPSIQLENWDALIADFLSFNTLEGIARDGVLAALQSDATQGDLTTLFSAEILERLASFGSTGSLQITPTATFVEVRGDAVIVHGNVAVQNASAPPEAIFVTLPGSTPTRRILHAGRSWAPGGRITQYRWDFGDGQSAVTSGTNLRFATEHTYAPGVYTTCLAVADDSGRMDGTCSTIRVRNLILRHTPEGSRALSQQWEVCAKSEPFTAEFQVLDGSTPLPDALVRVISPYGWEVSGYTDPAGKITFRLEPQHFVSLVGGPPNPSVRVEATKQGYYRVRENLSMVDCASRGQLINDLENFLNNLREILPIPLLDLGRPPPLPPGDGEPIDPRVTEMAADLMLAVDTLVKLVRLSDRRLGVLPVATLFGIDAKEGNVSKLVSERFHRLFASTLQHAEKFQKELAREMVREHRRIPSS